MGYYQKYLKRMIDISASFCGLVVLAPLLLAISALIKKEDGGDVFYRGTRVGKDGSLFRIYKFRTMVIDAEQLGGSSTADDDPRITNSGRLLRKYKLDELPQLINVLTGEMSLVGPRPQVPSAVDMDDPSDQIIHGVRPGIVDYASLKFHNEGELLRGSSDPDALYFELIHPEKSRLAKEYVENISARTDFKILVVMTISTVLKRIGVKDG